MRPAAPLNYGGNTGAGFSKDSCGRYNVYNMAATNLDLDALVQRLTDLAALVEQADMEAAPLFNVMALGRGLDALAEVSSLVIIGIDREDESFSVTVSPDGGGPRKTAVRATLAEALAAVRPGEMPGILKRCPRCKCLKELSQFARHKHSADGHWRYCKRCEKGRTRKYDKRKKGKG